MRRDEVEGGRGWEEEGMMKASSSKTTWRLLFSANEVFKLGEVNLTTRIKKENSSALRTNKMDRGV